MSHFRPDPGEILAIRSGLRGWKDVQGLGPDFFPTPEAEQDLLAFIYGVPASARLIESLNASRAHVVNFFHLLSGDGEFNPAPAASFERETATFLAQFSEQVEIWSSGTFKLLNFSRAEIDLLARVAVKSNPLLFFMGFPYAIPHSSQVSRLCANMAHALQGRSSEVFMAALVGKLHDPKLEPRFDLARDNLATHPVNAAALALTIFKDPEIQTRLVAYFNGNRTQAADFVEGLVDALSINNDSAFVGLQVVLPNFRRRVTEKYGKDVADGFESVILGRLESASSGVEPPPLPDHLHGCLTQEFLDTGLRGFSVYHWSQAVAQAGIETEDPVAFYHQLMAGNLGSVTQDKIAKLRAALRADANAVLKVMIPATRLLQHHQEVIPAGRVGAAALVIADQMMLAPDKVFAVYKSPVIDRIRSYSKSFDDNVRLLPRESDQIGVLWQRAVYLSMLMASDRLTGQKLLSKFARSHRETSVAEDIADLKALILNPESWGKWATASGDAATSADVKAVLEALELGYIQVVNQYRDDIYDAKKMEKFLPRPARQPRRKRKSRRCS